MTVTTNHPGALPAGGLTKGLQQLLRAFADLTHNSIALIGLAIAALAIALLARQYLRS